MQLTPREKDKLLVAMAAIVARKRLERGVKLNHPEAIALITDFVIEGARWLSRMRRISDLPSPNDLYLRMIEELYEPMAVEARLGRAADVDDDFPTAPPGTRADPYGGAHADPHGGGPPTTIPTGVIPDGSETLSLAIREALYGPTLSNYDGWVSVEVLDEGRSVPVSQDRHVRLEPGRSYELHVVIGADPATGTAEPLVVTGGVDSRVIEFTTELDSDQRALRRPSRPITVNGSDGTARFTIRTPDEGFAEPPWLWIRVSQRRRLLQSIELTATGPAMLER